MIIHCANGRAIFYIGVTTTPNLIIRNLFQIKMMSQTVRVKSKWVASSTEY